jgi:hypothetical protein
LAISARNGNYTKYASATQVQRKPSNLLRLDPDDIWGPEQRRHSQTQSPPLRKLRNLCNVRAKEAVMANALNVSASEFVRNFGRYQDQAIQSKVIVVTSYNRVVGGYLSAEELAHYERLKAREREVLRVGELNDETIADISAAEYGAEPQ